MAEKVIRICEECLKGITKAKYFIDFHYRPAKYFCSQECLDKSKNKEDEKIPEELNELAIIREDGSIMKQNKG